AELESHVEIDRSSKKIREHDLLEEAAVEHLAAADVEKILRIVEKFADFEIGEHQVDLVVRVAHRLGGETHHGAVANRERVMRKMPRVAIEEAELARAGGADVAVAIGDDEHRAARAHELLDVARRRKIERRSRLRREGER